MVDRNLIREFSVDEQELDATFGESLKEVAPSEAEMDFVYDATSRSFDVNEIIEGHVLSVNGDEVLVDIGYKSEGIVTLDEWEEGEELPKPGDTIQVLLEEIEDQYGLILLSKRKADRVREWEEVTSKHHEGDVVTGTVVRKIKGGLLIDIGVNVFLPASQVDIRRPPDIGEYIGKDIECMILKIDDARRNIVVSRRKLIEDQRADMKRKLMNEIGVPEHSVDLVSAYFIPGEKGAASLVANLPRLAWKVTRSEGGGLLWTSQDADGTDVTSTVEPNTTAPLRAIVTVIGWLPVEWLL